MKFDKSMVIPKEQVNGANISNDEIQQGQLR